MASRALVVGCDHYPLQPDANLRGAVRDALAFADWLLDPLGGRLVRQDLTMLLSPAPSGAQPRLDQIDGPATRGRLAGAVEALLAERRGDRLYVYFAGHGCRTDPKNPALTQDAILLQNVDSDDPGPSAVTVPDLRMLLGLSDFAELILIIDACRNYPYQRSFGVSRLGLDPEQAWPGEPRVFAVQSTAPGELSVGDGPEDDVRGIFSRALSEGLVGAGRAKIYDETRDFPYQVTWTSLCAYLDLAVTGQRPSYLGAGDLAFAAFPDGQFPDVQLTVAVDPGSAPATALAQLGLQVSYPQAFAPEDGLLSLPGPAPVTVRVPPRRIRIRATAGPDYSAKCSVDAYDDTSATVHLDRPQLPVELPPGGVILRGPGEVSSQLSVNGPDPSVVLEIGDRAGTVLYRSLGSATAELPLGEYVLRVLQGVGTRTLSLPVDLTLPSRLTTIDLADYAPWSSASPESGPLMWASPSARLAARLTQRSEEIAAHEPMIAYEEGGTFALHALDLASLGGSAYEDGAGHWGLEIAGRLIFLPAVAGVATCCCIESDRLVVGLFDRFLLADPVALALLDRAQLLAAAGDAGGVGLLLDELSRHGPSVVADTLLHFGARSDWPSLLAGDVSVSEAYRLIGDGPWSVLTPPTQERS